MTNLVLQEVTAPAVLSAQARRVSLEAQHEELSRVRVADTAAVGRQPVSLWGSWV